MPKSSKRYADEHGTAFLECTTSFQDILKALVTSRLYLILPLTSLFAYLLTGCHLVGTSRESSPASGMTPISSPEAQDVLRAPLPLEPQEVTLINDNSTNTIATYYPTDFEAAPGILLLHRRGELGQEPLIDLLWGDGEAGYAILEVSVPDVCCAAFTVSVDEILMIAVNGLNALRSTEGIDSQQIICIGSSIGANAIVSVGNLGCSSIISISPSGYPEIPYRQALEDLEGENQPPVLCIASEEDNPAAESCRGGKAIGLSDYQAHIYRGNAHSLSLLLEEETASQSLSLISRWLREHAPPAH